ncbi:MAG: esterase FrsA [Acidimicrobiia bacterium]|nr:esterase FrsA [Acidimicrobiia bacterium]
MASRRGLAERTTVKFRFRQDDFEFFFQWLTGMQTHGGSEVGEAFYAASRITDGDPESWAQEWSSLADRVAARARASLAAGHRVSAREAFLRAYLYRRAPLAFIHPTDARYRSTYQAAQELFRLGASLADPAIEAFRVPFEDAKLSGYLIRPSEDNTPRKTILMFGGGDTFVEDLYYYLGPAGTKRGYNVVIADLPGQGILPADGLVMRADAETPMTALIDRVVEYESVDHERLAAFGISAGGYLIPRATTVEKRIRACIASSAILDFYDVWTRNTSLAKLARLEGTPVMGLLERLPSRRVAAVSRLISTYMWRWGVDSITDLLEASRAMTFDPAQLSCPTLVLIGQQEYDKFEASRQWAHRCIDEAATDHKQLIVTPANEGAATHAIGTNLSLMSQLVFDWLDETFADSKTGVRQPERTAAT